jgi:hypothetical protein
MLLLIVIINFKKMFKTLKSTVLLSVAILMVAVSAQSPNCMYCKRADTNAGFLESYSYCASLNQCLKDQWNYLNRQCGSGWTLGK